MPEIFPKKEEIYAVKGNNGGETGDQSIGDVLSISVLNFQPKRDANRTKAGEIGVLPGLMYVT